MTSTLMNVTHTVIRAAHATSIVTTWLAGVAAAFSVLFLLDLQQQPILPFAGLGVSAILFGISIGSHCLEIFFERMTAPQLTLVNPPLYD